MDKGPKTSNKKKPDPVLRFFRTLGWFFVWMSLLIPLLWIWMSRTDGETPFEFYRAESRTGPRTSEIRGETAPPYPAEVQAQP
ncbi:MAG: hypothetical protein RLY93_16675 [Sumerlaeia bacterium]